MQVVLQLLMVKAVLPSPFDISQLDAHLSIVLSVSGGENVGYVPLQLAVGGDHPADVDWMRDQCTRRQKTMTVAIHIHDATTITVLLRRVMDRVSHFKLVVGRLSDLGTVSWVFVSYWVHLLLVKAVLYTLFAGCREVTQLDLSIHLMWWYLLLKLLLQELVLHVVENALI